MERKQKQVSLWQLMQDHEDLKREVALIRRDLNFQAKRASRLEAEKEELKQVLRQMMTGLSVEVEKLSKRDIDRKFNHLFKPVLQACIQVWKRKEGKPFHKREVAQALQPRYPYYSFLTFYRRMELLANPQMFNPPYLLHTGRGIYIVNWKAFQKETQP
jgi:hypothetical protein